MTLEVFERCRRLIAERQENPTDDLDERARARRGRWAEA